MRVPPGDARRDGWWRDAVVYQIYPRSFADHDGDGVGDLRGVADRLGDVADLGVDAVWLSPFYVSPQADAGYDVADHRDVDPLFGTLADIDAVIARAHALGLRILVDLVPNHSSDRHPWFGQALASAPGSVERSRYIFRNGRGPDGERPPNNWRSQFGGPAWTRVRDPDGRPGQWYLHLFDTSQPDFDWTSPQVRAEFLDIIAFWLARGVDGFRVDVAHGLAKAAGLPDAVGGDDEGPQPYWDQEAVHDVYREWRALLCAAPGAPVLVAEAWVAPERVARYVRPDEMHQAFNFPFLLTGWDAAALREVIAASITLNDAVGAPTTWVLSNHDVVRHASRLGLADTAHRPNGIGIGDPQPDAELGLARARAATLMMLALPGSAYIYQGEELGLPEHTTLDDRLRQDPVWRRTAGRERGRDGCRVPLPWQAGAPGLGFSPTGATWLPQPAAFRALARDRQVGVAGSTLELYRHALRERASRGLGRGALRWDRPARDGVVAFDNGGLAVVLNVSSSAVELPPGVLVACSGPRSPDGRLPRDTAAWVDRSG